MSEYSKTFCPYPWIHVMTHPTSTVNFCCVATGQVKRDKKICQGIFNVKDEPWEKVTFIGDSRAVDHVVSKDTAKAFKVHPTIASKAGINFRAASGGVIEFWAEAIIWIHE